MKMKIMTLTSNLLIITVLLGTIMRIISDKNDVTDNPIGQTKDGPSLSE